MSRKAHRGCGPGWGAGVKGGVQGHSILSWMQSLAVSSLGVGLQDMKDARLRGQGELLRPTLWPGGLPALQGSALGSSHEAGVGAGGAQPIQGPRFDPQHC